MGTMLMTPGQWHLDRWQAAAQARFAAAMAVASPPLLTATPEAPAILVVDGLVYAAWLDAEGHLVLQTDDGETVSFEWGAP